MLYVASNVTCRPLYKFYRNLYKVNIFNLFYANYSSLKQQSVGRHVAPLGHIILIPIQPVFALSA
jgi:hypothetical protein